MQELDNRVEKVNDAQERGKRRERNGEEKGGESRGRCRGGVDNCLLEKGRG